MLDEEVRRALQLLEAVIQAAGFSEEELETKLDAAPGYVGRLLAGEIELKLRHILAILQALEIDPGQYFLSLYPPVPTLSSTIRSSAIEMDALDRRLRDLGLGEPAEEPGGG